MLLLSTSTLWLWCGHADYEFELFEANDPEKENHETMIASAGLA